MSPSIHSLRKKPAKKDPSFAWSVVILGILVAAFAATIAHSQTDSAAEDALRVRSHRIFEYDEHVRRLPSHKLYTLSIALSFGDLKMAESLVDELEPLTKR